LRAFAFKPDLVKTSVLAENFKEELESYLQVPFSQKTNKKKTKKKHNFPF